MRTISVNAVRGRSYEKFFTRKFIIRESFFTRNFQIYGINRSLYRDTILDIDTKVLASWSLAQAHLPPTGRTESKLGEKIEQR